MTDQTDLIFWLRIQLDDDERMAREASGDTWVTGTSQGYEYSRPGDVYAISHDGAAARIAYGTACGPDISAEQSSAHIARHNPARVLSEVQAKRRLMQEVWTGVEDLAVNITESRGDDCGARDLRDELIKLLAAPYADRPGFDRRWLPADTPR